MLKKIKTWFNIFSKFYVYIKLFRVTHSYEITLLGIIHCLKRRHLSIGTHILKYLSQVLGLYHTLN